MTSSCEGEKNTAFVRARIARRGRPPVRLSREKGVNLAPPKLRKTATGESSVNTDPRDIISKEPMTKMQILVIVLTVFLNALDGFDVTSISFASPGIAAE